MKRRIDWEKCWIIGGLLFLLGVNIWSYYVLTRPQIYYVQPRSLK